MASVAEIVAARPEAKRKRAASRDRLGDIPDLAHAEQLVLMEVTAMVARQREMRMLPR
jgi:hypothetical protein